MTLPDLGTVVGVWAHPDDEAYLTGGLMALARDAGARVVCVTATRGERGTADAERWPPDRLAAVRAAELERSLAILGVVEHHALGLPDGGCAGLDPTGPVAAIAEILDAVAPDSVLTFGPDGVTGHPDHRAVSAWVDAAFGQVALRARLLHAAVPAAHVRRWSWLHDRFGVYEDGFPVVAPEERIVLDLRLDDATAARKVAALRAQATQTDGLVAALGMPVYTEWVRKECFVAA